MLELWVPLTIAAAFIQTIRTALQKKLLASLPNPFVNFARYAFGAPIAAVVFLLWAWLGSERVPALSMGLVSWCAVIAISQILGTWGLIAALATRNMAAAVTFAKTETLQTALLSALILGEELAPLGWLAIILSAAGIIALSLPVRRQPGRPAGSLEGAAYGLFAGAMFGLSATAIRTASTGLGDYDFLTRSLLVLAVTTALQLLMLGLYLAWQNRAGFKPFLRTWPLSLAVGVASVAGSIGWFTAMTLQKAAYVQALGQIELVISMLVTRFAFREPVTRLEALGIALFGIGIAIMLMMRA
jgi:drug/metabolite transporter (DMT)-like permease